VNMQPDQSKTEDSAAFDLNPLVSRLNAVQHLLVCTGEEGAEIAQDVSKCLRFGLDDRNVLNPTGPTNRERLVAELNDLVACANLLAEFGVIPPDWLNADRQIAKMQKVKTFMDYAVSVGALSANAQAEPPEEHR
jgi:hypothetical protein